MRRRTGIDPTNQIVTIRVIQVAWEVAATSLAYAVVGALERHEAVDVYDVDTDLNPFHLRRA
jgi:hypothetical protein